MTALLGQGVTGNVLLGGPLPPSRSRVTPFQSTTDATLQRAQAGMVQPMQPGLRDGRVTNQPRDQRAVTAGGRRDTRSRGVAR